MKKLFLSILMIAIVTPAMAAIQWRAGTGENVLDGTSAANLIGYNSYNKVVQPLDNLLGGYCTEYLQYLGQSTLTVKAGSCVVSNSQGSIRMFMLDPTDTNISAAANMDSGTSFAINTTYYVYVTSPNATTQTSTYYISTSSTAPVGQTYYFKLGQFTTDSNGYVTNIINATQRTIVAQGTIANGAVISLPSGFYQDQCKWVVSAGSVSNSYGMYAMNVSTDANRNVTSTASFNNWVSSSYNVTVGVTANYIIVCSK